MKAISAKSFIKVIETHGWRLLRINGSHHIFGKSDSVVRLSVPVHGNQALKTGLCRHLIKQAGLHERDFL